MVTGLYRHPAVGLARLAEEIRAYWTVAILPHWQRIQRLIEGEVLYRARMMARGGAGELFPGNPGSSTRHAASPRCGSAGSRARRTGWPESSAGPGRCSSPYSAPPPRPPSSHPRTDMSAPTVSHHLTALRAAGLVTSHRTGRTALYLRTEPAEALLRSP